jgi:hypothetical protein
LRPGRYKPRILRFRDMRVAANGENVLAVLWRSPESAARCTGGVLLRFPAKSTGSRLIMLVRSSLDSLCGAEAALTGRLFGTPFFNERVEGVRA